MNAIEKILAAGLVVMIGGAALAQNYESGSVAVPSPTGAEGIAVRGIGPQFERVSLSQIRDAGGYCPLTNPASGSTLQIPNNVSICTIVPTTTIATLTVALPTAPFDGQRVQFYTPQAITSFTETSTQAINTATPPPTALTAGGSTEFYYQLATQTWTRIQ